MSLVTTALERAFRYNSVDLVDPGSTYTPEQVRDFYSAAYPEIVSAGIDGPEQKDGKLIYTFRRAVGTKGVENQHRLIKGYRDLTPEEIALMNKIKAKGQEIENLLAEVQRHIQTQTVAAVNAEKGGDHAAVFRLDAAQPGRWASVARTDFQTALMALTRAVAQPESF